MNGKSNHFQYLTLHMADFPDELVMNRIYLIRRQKVILDKDLAELYDVDTKVLHQSVKRSWQDSLRLLCFS
jgi:hypothetical protein